MTAASHSTTGHLSDGEHRRVTALIVSWNSEVNLEACLKSLRASLERPYVAVLDNNSRDASLKIARSLADHVVANTTNAGFSVGVNRLLPHVDTPYTLLVNPDVVVEPQAIDRCLEVLTCVDDAGIVGASLRTADGTPDRAAARRFKSVRTVLIEALGLPRISPRLDWQHFPTWDRTSSREVPCVNGAFMLMRTDLLRALGGLDESVFMYLEDLDLCRRVRERGLSVWFCADAIATHIGGASTAAGNVDQQAIAHLHRLDGTIEFVVRTGRPGTRLVVVSLLMVQSVIAGVLGSISRNPVRAARHWRALPWLARQFARRHAPPPVPSS